MADRAPVRRPHQRPARRRPDTPGGSVRAYLHEQLQLKTVRTQCPELDALTRHVRSFATMLTDRQGERLPEWLDAVRQDDLPSLHWTPGGDAVENGFIVHRGLYVTGIDDPTDDHLYPVGFVFLGKSAC